MLCGRGEVGPQPRAGGGGRIRWLKGITVPQRENDVSRDSPCEVSGGCLCAQSLSCVQLLVVPRVVAHQAPPSLAFPRQGCWSGLPFPSPSPRIKPVSPAMTGGFFTTEPLGKPRYILYVIWTECVCSPPKCKCWCPKPPVDGIWKWDLWETVRVKWGHKGEAPLMGLQTPSSWSLPS